ncbi:uncharacterized protein UDID_18534 [Ustilago sp. UG-2017a]|nr:uncharacterized protein UDID_18534 [Ustilago sp. UG-2017a]
METALRPCCHGPECSGSRRAPVESMAVVQSPWRPWTPTDSHAKEERAHMRGRRRQEEDQAQGACRWLPLRGSRDKSQRNHHRSKEEEQCIGDRQVGPRRRSSVEEVDTAPEAQGCQARRRSSVEGVDTAQEDRSGARGPPCTVLDEEGTLWRERAGAVSLATL